MERIKHWVVENHDLAFAILLAAIVYGYFALTNDLFATHRTTFAIMERFAVLGLVGLSECCLGGNKSGNERQGKKGVEFHGCISGSGFSISHWKIVSCNSGKRRRAASRLSRLTS